MALSKPVVICLGALALLVLLAPALAPAMNQMAANNSRLTISQPASVATNPMAWNSDPRAKNSQASIVVADLASYWKTWFAAGGPGNSNPKNILCAVVKGADGIVKRAYVWFQDQHFGGIMAWFLKGDTEFIGAEQTMINTFNGGPKLGSGESWTGIPCNDSDFPNFPSGPLSLAQ